MGIGIRRPVVVLGAAAVCFSLLSVQSANAATFTVNSTADGVDANPGDGACATSAGACSLRAAIQEANSLAGDDTINLPVGTYQLTIAGTGEDAGATGDLDLLSNITILGGGASRTGTIIDGGGLDGVLDVRSGASVKISGVKVQNGVRPSGFGGGGIRVVSSTLTLENSKIAKNQASGGGGVGVFQGSTFTMTGGAIKKNTSSGSNGSGGGLSNSGATVTLTNVNVFKNQAISGAFGGGLGNFGGSMTLNGGVVHGNTAAVSGGGITENGSGSQLTISNAQIYDNSAASFGGGVIIGSDTTVTVIGSSIRTNSAGTGGGGIANVASPPGTAKVGTTVLTNNTPDNCRGPITSLGGNQSSDGSCPP